MVDIQAISTGLKLGEDGIWYSKDIHDISYPSDGNQICFDIEDRSFWFKHRNSCILTAVKSYPPPNDGTIFDVGGGNGFVSSALAAAGFNVALVEPGQTGASNAKRRGLETVICATLEDAQVKPQSLSAVGVFDVVEHIEDDLSFLTSIRDLLQKDGRIYVTVPAYSFLWSDEDEVAGHFRRYTRKSICNVIKSSGLEVEFCSYIFRFLPLPIALFRMLPYRMGLSQPENKTEKVANEHAVQGGAIASILNLVLNSEIETLKNNRTMGFGASCLLVAKKS